jgi:hypothetical protein
LGGLAVFPLTGVAAATTCAFRGFTPRTAMLAGCLVLLAGLAVTFAAIATTTAAAFLAGLAVGVGFGLTLPGVNRNDCRSSLKVMTGLSPSADQSASGGLALRDSRGPAGARCSWSG